MVVLSRQYAEKYILFLQFSAGGLHDWGILLVIPLELQGKNISHFPWHSQNKNSLSSKYCKNTQAYPYSGSKRNRLMKQAVTGHSCRDNTPALLQCHCKIRNPSFLKLSHASGCEAIAPHINCPWRKIPPSPPALPLGQMNFTIL